MNRRYFTKQFTAGLTGMAISPSLTWANFDNRITEAELIGKGNPVFFGTDYQLRKEAHLAFEKLRAAAASDDIQIKVVSSYRSYVQQNRIWDRKYKQFTEEGLSPEDAMAKIVEYSTIPGTSRHHWGTDLDLVAQNNLQLEDELLEAHFEPGAPFYDFKQWMNRHAASFGFVEVYTNAPERNGFKYEPWHFSYLPLSKKYLKRFLKIDLLSLFKEELTGGNFFTETFINKYIDNNILDINPLLK
ncbi:MAG: M15 family metallopeptidase [Flavobacteriaceae bacterium]|nr:M15 family metallopeptidase [Flavobacteriaceae bacterium]